MKSTFVPPSHCSQPTALCVMGESSLKTSAATARPFNRNHPPSLRSNAANDRNSSNQSAKFTTIELTIDRERKAANVRCIDAEGSQLKDTQNSNGNPDSHQEISSRLFPKGASIASRRGGSGLRISNFEKSRKRTAALRRTRRLPRGPAPFWRICSPSLQTPRTHGDHAFPRLRKQTAAGWIPTSSIK